MADYFDEMGWRPLAPGETPNNLLHMARLLRDFNMFEELGETDRLPPPASKQVVADLEKDKITITESDQQCPICLKNHTKGETAVELPCKHKYHSNCILPWLAQTNSCPLCRHELPTDDENYEAYRKEKLRAKQREADIECLHNSMFS